MRDISEFKSGQIIGACLAGYLWPGQQVFVYREQGRINARAYRASAQGTGPEGGPA